ncbi:MAG: hypothetical protein JWP87_1917 [Labilithrix sp.]|nr:hypothetical protein [Labilithrix sp.]
MKVSSIRKGVVFVVVAGTLALGCELIVDFDRTKIPVEGNDGSVVLPDASLDAPLDTSAPDTGMPDAADAAETSTDAAGEADAPDGD